VGWCGGRAIGDPSTRRGIDSDQRTARLIQPIAPRRSQRIFFSKFLSVPYFGIASGIERRTTPAGHTGAATFLRSTPGWWGTLPGVLNRLFEVKTVPSSRDDWDHSAF